MDPNIFSSEGPIKFFTYKRRYYKRFIFSHLLLSHKLLTIPYGMHCSRANLPTQKKPVTCQYSDKDKRKNILLNGKNGAPLEALSSPVCDRLTLTSDYCTTQPLDHSPSCKRRKKNVLKKGHSLTASYKDTDVQPTSMQWLPPPKYPLHTVYTFLWLVWVCPGCVSFKPLANLQPTCYGWQDGKQRKLIV